MALPIRRLMPMLIVLASVLVGAVLGAVALPGVLAKFESPAEPAAARPRSSSSLGRRSLAISLMLSIVAPRRSNIELILLRIGPDCAGSAAPASLLSSHDRSIFMAARAWPSSS